jgi:hypothetical protein
VLVRPGEGVEAVDAKSIPAGPADAGAKAGGGGDGAPGRASQAAGSSSSGLRPRTAPPQSPAPTAADGASGPAPKATTRRDRPLRRQGIAINTRVDDDETILLTALGFEVVRDRCEFFTDEIQGYATWLRDFAKTVHQLEEGKGR